VDDPVKAIADSVMTASIRPARLQDAPGIAKVQVDSWRSTYKGLIDDVFLAGLSYDGRSQNWTQNLTAPQKVRFLQVAETEPGQIVGFVFAGPEREGDPIYQGEIYAIYLFQQAQGQGLGRKLILTAMQELCERGFSSMLLWVLKDNLAARKFYEAVGGDTLREKPVELGSQILVEVAYGRKNPPALVSKKE
jgi:ribosomal protein S18 acetylase RimI-like enzyme